MIISKDSRALKSSSLIVLDQRKKNIRQIYRLPQLMLFRQLKIYEYKSDTNYVS